MAARFVPSKRVFPLFYPVFDLSPPIVDRDYSLCFHVRVGYDESDTGEEFPNMPFDLTDNPPRLIPFLRMALSSLLEQTVVGLAIAKSG